MENNLPIFWRPSFVLRNETEQAELFIFSLAENVWTSFDPKKGYSADFGIYISGIIRDKIFSSPFKASFGGFFWESSISTPVAKAAIATFPQFLKSKYGCNKIQIHLPPRHLLGPASADQADLLESAGFGLVYSNLNFVVEVATWSHSSLSKGNRKKLRQCIEANLLSRPLQPAEIPMAYELIKRNRQDIGTKISVSFQEISKNLNYYPSLYRCFGTFVENKLVAAAFTIRTWENNEYVFLWGDSIDHRNLSPVVHLCDFLVTWCSSEQVRFLDLGTASIEGQPLEGLVRFKQNLGAIIFQKQTLELSTLS